MRKRNIPGEWRSQYGKRPAHLYKDMGDWNDPICGARVAYVRTMHVEQPMDADRCCTECLVNAIGDRNYNRKAV